MDTLVDIFYVYPDLVKISPTLNEYCSNGLKPNHQLEADDGSFFVVVWHSITVNHIILLVKRKGGEGWCFWKHVVTFHSLGHIFCLNMLLSGLEPPPTFPWP